MLRYDIRSGVKKIKTKTALSISAITLGISGLGVAVAVPLVSHAEALPTINFETTQGYNVGNIDGQQGWSKSGLYDVAVSPSLGITGFGLQSLRTSDAVTSRSFGDQTFSPSLANEAGETNAQSSTYSGGTRQPHYVAQFDLASVMSTIQGGMHVSVSPDRGDGARMSYLRFEDQADGIHVFFDEYKDAAPFGTLATPADGCGVGDDFTEADIATLTRSPHTIKFDMNFLDGPRNDVVKIYIDGVVKATGTSWEDYFRWCSESGGGVTNDPTADVSRTVDSLLFRESGTANPADQGKGFLIDNLSLLSGPIPLNMPTSKDQCKGDGWKSYGTTFKNQGDCVSYVATHGKNQANG